MKKIKNKIVKKSFVKQINESKNNKNYNKLKKSFKSYFVGLWSPQFKILIAYIMFILIGASLLIIPGATTNSVQGNKFDFWDALFSSSSAFSNTGLLVSNTYETFTIYGQIVIYFLIQIGGFGLLSTFFLLGRAFNKIFLHGREFKSILGHAEKGQTKISSSFRILIVIFFIIFSFQLMSTFVLWPIFHLIDFNIAPIVGTEPMDNGVGFGNLGLSFWNSLFLTGSAMNNAGFDIFSPASDGSLGTFFGGTGIIVQVITLSLFVFGGIGYMVIYDIWKVSIFWIYKNHPRLYKKLVNAKLSEEFLSKPRFSTYTKICLIGNVVIITISLIFAYAIEWISYVNFDGNVSNLSDVPSWMKEKLTGLYSTNVPGELLSGPIYSTSEVNFAIFFSTMSTRSAGFSTIDMSIMAEATKWLFSFLMMIGTSPSSTGGGVRVTTVIVLISAVIQKISGTEYSVIFKKQISKKTIINASITLILAIFSIGFSTYWITLFDKNITFPDAFFLSASAFGTTGLTTIQPESLGLVSFFTLVPLMIIGQLGVTNMLETFNIGHKKYSKVEPEVIDFRVG